MEAMPFTQGWETAALPEHRTPNIEHRKEKPMSKSIFFSKTFWLQVAALVSAMFPVVQDWLVKNPVEFVAVLASLNVIVRFLTSGKVSILDDTTPVNGIGFWFSVAVGCVAGTALASGLVSCSADQLAAARAVPVKACYVTNEGRVCYSNVEGLSAEIDARSGK